MARLALAEGHPDMSGGYIPTLYAATLLVEFYAATVFGAIANTEYEGTIQKYGDKVEIRTLPEVTINDYVVGQKLAYAKPDPSKVTLEINKGKYWAFEINLVDEKQSDIDYINKWAVHAAAKMKIAIDSGILSDIYSDVHASNTGSAAGVESGNINLGVAGTPLEFKDSTALDIIVDAGVVLDEQNVPDDGRFLVLPAWACGNIKKSDLKDASITGDGKSILRNGRIGMVDRFEIFMSNNVAKNTDDTAWHAMFGQKEALTFASQLTHKEMIPNMDDFGQLLRALQVYGYEVVKPEALGQLYIDKG
jgi:hypothetical protein